MDVCFICIVTILVPKAAVPTLAAARMQHWRVIAQAHNYQVKYWPSKEQGHADALSRLPCNKRPLKEEAEILFFSGLEELPIDAEKDISGETRRDLVVESLNIGTTEIRCSYLSCVFYQFCKRWIKAELYEGYPSNIGHHWFARVSFKS